MKSFKEIVGAEPIYHEEDNSYTPSKASLVVGAPKKSDYDHTEYETPYSQSDNKILVLCVDEPYLECANGKKMRTGNHPIELFVVLMHLEKAGFEPVFATLSGNAVTLEEFAMPIDDEAVVAYREKHQANLSHPRKISEVISELDSGNYKSVYIPGGHGAVLGLPESIDVKTALTYFIENDKYIISICHGPSSFLALAKDSDLDKFPFEGYDLACFPDSGDKMMESAGYLPGPMPFGYSTLLEGLGMNIKSKVPIGVTHVDRRLITGDTPMAANKLGKLAAECLLGIQA